MAEEAGGGSWWWLWWWWWWLLMGIRTLDVDAVVGLHAAYIIHAILQVCPNDGTILCPREFN